MMTPEEKEARKAEREAALIANLSGPRTGYSPAMLKPAHEAAPAVEGLELSDLQTKPLDWFRPNPVNHVFDALKTPDYWKALKKDIAEARTILNPVIALPDGTLIEGHSRVKVAKELKAEGVDLGRVPVLIVASPISQEEAERRVYLGNLSRFEIDEDTRLALYAKIWPGYFLADPGKGGRPKNPDTVAEFSAPQKKDDTVSGFPSTAEAIGKATGKSSRQIIRDRGTVRQAAEIAKNEGKAAPDAGHIRKVREAENAKRREAAPKPSAADVLKRLEAMAVHAEKLAERGGSGAAQNKARAEAFREALEIVRKAFG